MSNKILLRSARWADAGVLADIFSRAVQAIDDAVYSPEEKAAWLQDANHLLFWQQRLQTICPIVAEQDGKVVGFIEYQVEQGYIDCLYIDPLYQRRGIASVLLQHILQDAQQHQASLSVHASAVALAFFQQHGFTLHTQNHVVCQGHTLINYHLIWQNPSCIAN